MRCAAFTGKFIDDVGWRIRAICISLDGRMAVSSTSGRIRMQILLGRWINFLRLSSSENCFQKYSWLYGKGLAPGCCHSYGCITRSWKLKRLGSTAGDSRVSKLTQRLRRCHKVNAIRPRKTIQSLLIQWQGNGPAGGEVQNHANRSPHWFLLI